MSPIISTLANASGRGYRSFAAAAAPAFESIATINGNGSSTELTFSSIPSTYKHLQIRTLARNLTASANLFSISLRFNNDSGSNYVAHTLIGNGATVTASGNTGQTAIGSVYYPTDGTTTNAHGVGIIDIHDYSSTSNYKTVRYFTGNDTNSGSALGQVKLGSGLWLDTSAITSITLRSGSLDGYTTSTQFALYGIKGA